MAMPLISTKIRVPPSRPEWMPRPRLLRRLDDAMRCKLILISAPPGFGKTTLLVDWLQHPADERDRRDAKARATLPLISQLPRRPTVAWLSLDEGDDDPTRFWTYLVATLQVLRRDLGETVLAALRRPGELGAAVVTEETLAELINDLAAHPAPLVLILDDFHVITHPAIHDGLRFLLENLPPAAHMILATRSDPAWPLARLRARGELAELRADDLRLTPDEAAAFLNDVMGLHLSAEEVAALDARTEGWIAGLQMAALSMHGREDPAALIRTFGGSHRFVLDYLVEEVLDRQPPTVQAFLLRTSILERLCGPLCDAMIAPLAPGAPCPPSAAAAEGGDEARSGQAILEQLERANLFLVPLDDERGWYRYHRLFADLLRARLTQLHPEEPPLLHRRASEWCEANGHGSEAITHALAAADYERAADLIERHAQEILWRGEAAIFRNWLKALPEATIRPRPFLCLGNAHFQPTPEATESWLQAAEVAAAERRTAALPADTAGQDICELLTANIRSMRLRLAHWRGDAPEKLIELVRDALATTPASARLERAGLSQQLGSLYLHLGQEDAAEAAWLETEKLACDTNVALAMDALYNRATIPMNHGRLRKTAAIFRQALHTAVRPAEEAGRQVPAFGAVYVGLGRVLLEFNELDEAEECLTHGLKLISATLGHGVLVSACIALSRLRCARRDFAEAQLALDQAEALCTWNPVIIPALRVHAWLSQAGWEPGVLENAIRWADEQDLAQVQRTSPIMHGLARTRIWQRRKHGTPDLGPIVSALDQGLEQAATDAQLAWTVDLLALKALALQAEGRGADALAVLQQALAAGEPESYCRTFLQHGRPMADLLHQAIAARNPQAGYAGRLLASLERELHLVVGDESQAGQPRRQPASSRVQPVLGTPPLVEPLSERELEILRLLNTPLSSTEIATQLMVSTNTVRTHIKNIYGKLGVHDRVTAVSRGRQAGLF